MTEKLKKLAYDLIYHSQPIIEKSDLVKLSKSEQEIANLLQAAYEKGWEDNKKDKNDTLDCIDFY